MKSENLTNIRKYPEKIWKPDKNPEKNIIISHLISKVSIMSRNIVQIIEIRRFDKTDKKKEKKKRFSNFVRSFAHKVNMLTLRN